MLLLEWLYFSFLINRIYRLQLKIWFHDTKILPTLISGTVSNLIIVILVISTNNCTGAHGDNDNGMKFSRV